MRHGIDVRDAFSLERGQDQSVADWEKYLNSRPEEVVPADWHKGQSILDDPALDHITTPYENMNLMQLAKKMGEADSYGDRTTRDDVGEVLLEKFMKASDGMGEELRTSLLDKLIVASGITEAEEMVIPEDEEPAGHSAVKTESVAEPEDEPPIDDEVEEPVETEQVEEQDEPELELILEDATEMPEELVFTADDINHLRAFKLARLEHDKVERPIPSRRAIKLPESSEEELEEEESAKTQQVVTETIQSKTVEGLKVTEGFAEQSLHGQDSILVNHSLQIYGVFDGAGGGGGNPAAASRAASESFLRSAKLSDSYAVSEFADKDPLSGSFNYRIEVAKDILKVALTHARHAVDQDGGGGLTTAATVKLYDIYDPESDGMKKVAIWANAGDSRIFLANSDDQEIVPLSTDQSSGHKLHNALGRGFRDTGQDEVGVLVVRPGQRIMICSDGITGDYEHQFLTEEEMADAMFQPTPQAAAERFIKVSKKPDDKSVVIVDIR